MPQVLVINGPNLGRLGTRATSVYGITTLAELEVILRNDAASMDLTLDVFQSDVEGEIIRYVDAHRGAAGLVLNPGALMMAGWSLRDCLEDFEGMAVEVHLSNVFARESFRHQSVLADVMDGFIAGLGVDGYRAALESIARRLGAR